MFYDSGVWVIKQDPVLISTAHSTQAINLAIESLFDRK